jgi:hypothetical protein
MTRSSHNQGETAMVTNTLRCALCVAALSSTSIPSRAQTIEVDSGIFCDTQKQVERFVAVLDGDTRAAINTVNAEENDPTACVFGTVAYIRGPEIATTRSKSGTYHIVRVIVVGFVTEGGLRAAGPAASFSAKQIDERIA